MFIYIYIFYILYSFYQEWGYRFSIQRAYKVHQINHLVKEHLLASRSCLNHNLFSSLPPEPFISLAVLSNNYTKIHRRITFRISPICVTVWNQDIRIHCSQIDSHNSYRWENTSHRFSFLMLYLQHWDGRRATVDRQETVSRRWQTASAESVWLLVHLRPKESASQHLSQHSNHRLTAAITDLATNQSQMCTQTSLNAYWCKNCSCTYSWYILALIFCP